MAKRIVKFVSFFLFAALIAGTVIVSSPVIPVSADRTIMQVEKELSDCKNQLAQVRAELASIQSQITDLQNRSGQNESAIAEYVAEIEALEADMALNELIRDSYDQKRADVAAQIAVANREYEDKLDLYANLIRFIYENSSVSTFELLFTSDGISDYLSRRDNFANIADTANEIIVSLKQDLNDLEILKKELEATQKEYDDYIESLKKVDIEYKQKVAQYEAIAQELNLNADDLRTQYSGKNAVIAELTAKIKKLEEERTLIYAKESEYKWPLASNVSYYVSSYFGYRLDPFGKKTTKFHQGLDIACNMNSTVIASKSGIVTTATVNRGTTGYGTYVVIYHGNGMSTLYGHLNKIADGIKVGVSVKQGETIGYSGNTGASTGPHLHFGVINVNQRDAIGTNYEDPDKYLPDGYYAKRNNYKK